MPAAALWLTRLGRLLTMQFCIHFPERIFRVPNTKDDDDDDKDVDARVRHLLKHRDQFSYCTTFIATGLGVRLAQQSHKITEAIHMCVDIYESEI